MPCRRHGRAAPDRAAARQLSTLVPAALASLPPRGRRIRRRAAKTEGVQRSLSLPDQSANGVAAIRSPVPRRSRSPQGVPFPAIASDGQGRNRAAVSPIGSSFRGRGTEDGIRVNAVCYPRRRKVGKIILGKNAGFILRASGKPPSGGRLRARKHEI